MPPLLVRVGDLCVPWSERSQLGSEGDAVVVTADDSPADASAVPAGPDPAAPPRVVVATRPVTDTLKQVDDDGTVLGTADRDRYRLVGTPFTAPLSALLAVRAPDPTPDQVLAELAAAGLPVTAS